MISTNSSSRLFGAEALNSEPVAFSRYKKNINSAALTIGEYKSQACQSMKIAIGPRNHEDCPHGVTASRYVPSDAEALANAISSAYRQVYGNAHLMDSERSSELEAQLGNGELTIKEFVRRLAKTNFYYSRFFEAVAPQRGIELNIQQLLGRAPIDQKEISAHISLLATSGHEAVVDFIIDSAEYFEVFGSDIVPYKRSWRSAAGIPTSNFANMAALEKSFATSNSAIGGKSQIASTMATGRVPYIKLPSQVYSNGIIRAGNAIARMNYPSKVNNIAGVVSPFRNDLYVGFGLGQREQEMIQRYPGDSRDQLNSIIRSTYRQVMGNPHIMEFERALSAESKFLEGYTSTRELVRSVALSPEYARRFFETNAPYRFVELNFKHLLGRAPSSQKEVSEHIQILANEGYDAEINSYIDSAEYQSMFGEDTVPFMRILTEKGRSQLAFNRHLSLSEGYAASDTVQNSSATVNSIATGRVPSGWRNTTVRINRNSAISGVSDPTKKRFRINVQAQAAAARQRTANSTYVVSGKDMSTQIKYILSRGGRIASITEIM